jgi:Mrp family chromosome partitioning ATPase
VPTSDEAGVFAALWTKLRYFTPAPVQSVLVTSASRGEGNTTVALQLAAAAAPNGRILLVEADFHHPTLGQRLGLSGLGLSDLLVGVAGVESCLKSVAAGDRDEAPASFDVLLAGTKPPYPLSLMDSPSLQAFLSEVEDAYEAVILDCPPLVSSPDAIPLVRLVSGVVVVAHARTTSRRDVAELRDILESLGAYVFGEVINGARTHDEFHERRYART